MPDRVLKYINDLIKSQGVAVVILLAGIIWMTYLDYYQQEKQRERMLYLERKVDACNAKMVELLQAERLDIEGALKDLEEAVRNFDGRND